MVKYHKRLHSLSNSVLCEDLWSGGEKEIFQFICFPSNNHKLDGTVYSTWYQGGRYSVQHMVSNWTDSVHHMVSNWTVQCTAYGIELDGTVYSTWYQTG